MPIQNRDDAVEVEERIRLVFAASPAQRAAVYAGVGELVGNRKRRAGSV